MSVHILPEPGGSAGVAQFLPGGGRGLDELTVGRQRIRIFKCWPTANPGSDSLPFVLVIPLPYATTSPGGGRRSTHDALAVPSSSLSGYRPGEGEGEGDGRCCSATLTNESRTRASAPLSGDSVPPGASIALAIPSPRTGSGALTGHRGRNAGTGAGRRRHHRPLPRRRGQHRRRRRRR